MTEETKAASVRWAIIEIMGHHRTAGKIEEVQQFGATMLRVDRPHEDGTFTTEFYGGSAIYAPRPCQEEIARRAAYQMYEERPLAPLSYRLPAPQANDNMEEFVPDDDQDAYSAAHPDEDDEPF